ncbi:hypothetical protein BpHYR1_013985 [Brachionus plicatilis]|uniref:Uncharacterized protein n=1 Tax=Brachionus plicatilis TaxID=10195 RepID=A0A3M7SSY6_BRAPC|nr:hypothetical protein BpHYR1_013985 [Brachionus plicatilis]
MTSPFTAASRSRIAFVVTISAFVPASRSAFTSPVPVGSVPALGSGPTLLCWQCRVHELDWASWLPSLELDTCHAAFEGASCLGPCTHCLAASLVPPSDPLGPWASPWQHSLDQMAEMAVCTFG